MIKKIMKKWMIYIIILNILNFLIFQYQRKLFFFNLKKIL